MGRCTLASSRAWARGRTARNPRRAYLCDLVSEAGRKGLKRVTVAS